MPVRTPEQQSPLARLEHARGLQEPALAEASTQPVLPEEGSSVT